MESTLPWGQPPLPPIWGVGLDDGRNSAARSYCFPPFVLYFWEAMVYVCSFPAQKVSVGLETQTKYRRFHVRGRVASWPQQCQTPALVCWERLARGALCKVLKL